MSLFLYTRISCKGMSKLKKWQPQHLSIPHFRNIRVDKLIRSNVCIPLDNNIINIPVEIYVDCKYIPDNSSFTIRSNCDEMDGRHFIMKKYIWTR